MADGKLTSLAVSKMKKLGHHNDGGGLYLRVAEGRKSWMFRYKTAGKTHWQGLGPVADIELSEAREAARQCRRQLRDGIDPIEARRAAKAAALAQQGITFRSMGSNTLLPMRIAGAMPNTPRNGPPPWKPMFTP